MNANSLVQMRAISKSFGATRALLDVDLSVHCGEVHALVGENGAGKSTLVKILAGAEKRDAGTIHLAGKRFEPRHPAHTLAAGIVVIYQELNLAGHLNAAENIFLGQEETAAGFLLDRQAAESAHKLLPADGVYAVRVKLSHMKEKGVMYVGPRPSFDGRQRLVEVHVMEFSEQIYGAKIHVEVVDRLRGDIRFRTPCDLVEQIKLDIASAQKILTGQKGAL